MPNRLDELLEQRGWKATDLFREIARKSDKGVSLNTLYKVMAGRSVRLETAQLIASALGVSVDDVFPQSGGRS